MATYASLTDQQKADLATYDSFLRSLYVQLAKVYKDTNADFWASFAATRIDPVVTTIDAAELIPNSTNYANCTDLSSSEFSALMGIAKGMRTQFQTNFTTLVKAVGTNI